MIYWYQGNNFSRTNPKKLNLSKIKTENKFFVSNNELSPPRQDKYPQQNNILPNIYGLKQILEFNDFLAKKKDEGTTLNNKNMHIIILCLEINKTKDLRKKNNKSYNQSVRCNVCHKGKWSQLHNSSQKIPSLSIKEQLKQRGLNISQNTSNESLNIDLVSDLKTSKNAIQRKRKLNRESLK